VPFHLSIVRLVFAVLGASLCYLAEARAVPPPTQEGSAGGAPGDAEPWRRVLDAADAKRVTDLAKKINELEEAHKYAEAQVPAQEILNIRKKAQGTEHWQTADAGRRLEQLARLATLSADERTHFLEAESATAEARKLQQGKKFSQAEPLFRKALALHQRLFGEDHTKTASSYNELAQNLTNQGRRREGEALVKKALTIYRRTLGEDHPSTASCIGNVAVCLAAQGKYSEAEPFRRKQVELRGRLLGEDHLDTGLSCLDLAIVLDEQQKYAQAAPFFRRALSVHQKVLGDGHPDTANVCDWLTSCLYQLGQFAQMEKLYRQVLLVKRGTLDDNDPDLARVYYNMSTVLFMQGKYAEAEPFSQKMLAFARRHFGEEHPVVARAYQGLGMVFYSQGKFAVAQPLFEKAMVLNRQFGPTSSETAASYDYLGRTYEDQGQQVQAEVLLRKALAINRARGEERPETARSYDQLGFLLDGQGKYAAGEAWHQKALAIRRRVLGENHSDTAVGYDNVAANLRKQGKFAEAEPLHEKALTIFRQVLGEEHHSTARCYSLMAANFYAEGKYADAERTWTKAVHSFEAARARVSISGLERASFASTQSPLRDLAAVLARQDKRMEAWQRLEASLARGLLDELARPLTEEEQSQEQQLLWNLRRLDDRIEQVLNPSRGKALTAALRQQAKELQEQRDQQQASLAQFEEQLVKKYGLSVGRVYDLPAVQTSLPDDAALVAWLDIKGDPSAADPNGEHWACVVRRRGQPTWVKLPGSGRQHGWTEDDDDLPGRVRLALGSQPGEFREDRQGLTRLLIAQRLTPVEDSLGSRHGLPPVRQLIVLPSPALAGIPVEALTDRYTISYAPSGTLFAWLQEKRHRPSEQTRKAAVFSLLALGDPTFRSPPTSKVALAEPPDHGIYISNVVAKGNAAQGGIKPGDVLLSYAGTNLGKPADLERVMRTVSEAHPGDARAGSSGIAVQIWRAGRTLPLTVQRSKLEVTLGRNSAAQAVRAQREGDQIVLRSTDGEPPVSLPGTGREVEAICRIFARPSAKVVKLLHSDASEQKVDQLAASGELGTFRYLHFATHGQPDSRTPMRSALLLAQAGQPDPLELALAGREARGRLTAERIRRTWKLDADLVTLSACQSGLGRLEGSEGYLGFAQALFLAGARSVVLSLWKVDDTATALLMARFYQNLLGKRPGLKQPLSKAEALREAKHWLRGLTTAEVEALQEELRAGRLGTESAAQRQADADAERPYAHPHYWAAFILIGDPF
jgi:tetratricopeptide (TPR) repeat protein